MATDELTALRLLATPVVSPSGAALRRSQSLLVLSEGLSGSMRPAQRGRSLTSLRGKQCYLILQLLFGDGQS